MNDAQRERPPREDARDADAVDGEPGALSRGMTSSDGQGSAAGTPPDAPIRVGVVGRTDVGLVREHNEDNYLLADLGTGSRDPLTFHEVPSAGLLLAVCDGMGGAAAGEVASQMAVDTIYEMMRKGAPSGDRDTLARNLVRSIEEAGSRIFESARADRSRRGMGTTATVAALIDKTLFVGQVGDSRAYVLRAGELKQVTKDQSLVNQLIEAGQLTEDEAEAFEHSNIILQALGTTEQVSVDLTFLELRQGDRLLMCSDGLSGLVHGDVIREVMIEQRDLASCCERLIELAKAGGGHDNVTVLLAEFTGEGLAAPQPSDLFGYQQYPLPLDQERRGQPAIHSEMPTLSPPSLRAPPLDDLELPREARAQQPSSSSAGRLFLLAMLIVGGAGAIYYWMAARSPRGQSAEATPAIATVNDEQRTAARVEVLVRTDVESAELMVDGETYGAAKEGQWTLELPPGPHRLEARAGGSIITSTLVTVREGSPAAVVLSMPEGASLALTDSGVDPKAEPSGKALRKGRERSGSGLYAEDASDKRARRRERVAGESAEREATETSSARDASLREAAPREATPREATPREATPRESVREVASDPVPREAGAKAEPRAVRDASTSRYPSSTTGARDASR
jgi:PPM family protein phosphatase